MHPGVRVQYENRGCVPLPLPKALIVPIAPEHAPVRVVFTNSAENDFRETSNDLRITAFRSSGIEFCQSSARGCSCLTKTPCARSHSPSHHSVHGDSRSHTPPQKSLNNSQFTDFERIAMLRQVHREPGTRSRRRYSVISEPTERLAYVVSPLRRRKLMNP
jgi:hypothetical protein